MHAKVNIFVPFPMLQSGSHAQTTWQLVKTALEGKVMVGRHPQGEVERNCRDCIVLAHQQGYWGSAPLSAAVESLACLINQCLANS